MKCLILYLNRRIDFLTPKEGSIHTMDEISCCERPLNSPLISCSGICGKAFHCKCVGFTANVRDKIMEGGNGLFWYCEECRSHTTALYVAKFLKYKDLFTGFMNQLKILESRVSGVSSEINSLTADIPDSLLPSPPSILLSPPTPAADTDKVSKEFPSPHGNSPSINQALQGTVSEPSTSTVSQDNESASSNPTGLVVVTPAPRNRVIFLSRLSPDTTEDQLLAHVKLKYSSSPLASQFFCRKITSRMRPQSEALLASFKLFAPPELFEAVCSRRFWPDGVLVKEFIPRTVRLPAASQDFPTLPSLQQQPPPRQ